MQPDSWETLAQVLSREFTPSELEWRVLELSEDGASARLRPQLRYSAVVARLDSAATRGGWSNRYHALGEAVSAEISVGTLTKAAVAQSAHVSAATSAQDAFVRAAELLGMVPPVAKGEYWVDYDAENGTPLYEPDVSAANTPMMNAAGQAEPSFNAVVQPNEPVQPVSETPDETSPKAVIDRLIDRLGKEGLGLEAAKLVNQHGGYGEDTEAARTLYKKLRALLLKDTQSKDIQSPV